MKKLISVLLSLLLVLGCPTAAFAADPPSVGQTVPQLAASEPERLPEPGERARLRSRGASEWSYQMTEDGMELWRYLGSDTDVTVPAEIGGYPVVRLYQTFWGNTSVETVTLPETVTTVGRGAFYGCTSLRSVTGGTVTALGEVAFYGCTLLAEAPKLHEGIETLPESIFNACAALEHITVPASVTAIEAFALYGCESLQELELPKGLVSIGKASVYGCTSLTELELPGTLTSIGEHAFNWSSNIAELDIPDSVTEIGDYAFYHSTRLIVGEGSCAQRYCVEQGFQYQVRGGLDLTAEIAPDATTAAAKADAIVAALVHEGMSDYEKALILHDYLILHAGYDNTRTHYRAEDILLDGLGVCQAYTEAYAMLLQRAGIPCATETGDDHIWNMAQLDGVWVHIDCTWDDPCVVGGEVEPQISGFETHTFFGITNYALEGVESHECFGKQHIAESVERSYLWQTGLLPVWAENLETELGTEIQDGALHGSVTESFTGSDSHGITNKLIYQAASFDALSWHDYPVTLGTDFDWTKPSLRYDAYVQVPAEETAVLPQELTVLEAESLRGVAAVRYVLPGTLTEIAEDAFSDGAVLIEAPEGSYALSYAEAAGLPWQFLPAE